jgi:uncharacterized protein YidB (DUF937 family)
MNVSKTWKRILIGGAAALTLAGGLLISAGPVSAQEAPPQRPAKGAWQGSFPHPPMPWVGGLPGGPDGELRSAYQEHLAEALGVSVEDLEAARESAQAAMMEEAVADGRITQEQADLMQAGRALRDYIDKDAIMASALGISVDELNAARDEETGLRELFQGQGLDRQTLRENMKNAMNDILDQAVADGVITQEQADQLQEKAQNGFAGHSFGGPGFEGRGMPGGFFGHGNR